MDLEGLREHLDAQATRRRIVKTGVRLAYAAPIVAATFKLAGSGVLAQTICVCGCTVGGPWLFNPSTGRCESQCLPGTPGCPPSFECRPTCVS
jgi:hypothetical protein